MEQPSVYPRQLHPLAWPANQDTLPLEDKRGSNYDDKRDSKHTITHLLAVGPLPPPLSGANVSFQVFCEHLTTYTHVQSITVIDTSPKRIKDDISILTMSNLRQAWRIISELWREGRAASCIVIFGSNQFLLSLTPLLIIAARLLGKPCYVRSFGGSLDEYSQGLRPFLRRVLLWGFGRSNGLLVETKLLHNHFSSLLPNKVHHITAYRPLEAAPMADKRAAAESETLTEAVQLRLIFISWVRAEKGVRDLLQALQLLTPEEQTKVRCDIYGPIVDSYATEFDRELAATISASYGGQVDNAKVVEAMQGYDALIFPTYYQGEGYPGVIVEAMAAGIPVITTNYRAIPDMVENGANGWLVPIQDPPALAAAIRSALNEPIQLRSMGMENRRRQSQYDIRTVLPAMVEVMEANL